MSDIKKGDVVVITKIGDRPGHKGLSMGYQVEGLLVEDINVGDPLSVARYRRNDVIMTGNFRTSPIVAIDSSGAPILMCYTQNSVYMVEPVPSPEEKEKKPLSEELPTLPESVTGPSEETKLEEEADKDIRA